MRLVLVTSLYTCGSLARLKATAIFVFVVDDEDLLNLEFKDAASQV